MEPADNFKYLIWLGCSMLGMVWRAIIRPAERTFKVMVVNLCICIPLGMLAGGLAQWIWEAEFAGYAAASAASYLAREILTVVDKEFIIRMRDRIADKFTA